MQPHLLDRYRKSLHLKITVPALAIMIAVVATLSTFAAVLVKDSLRHTVYESARTHAVLMSDDHTLVLSMLNKDASDLNRILKTSLDSTGAAVAVAVYTREPDGTHELLHRVVKRPQHAVFFPPRLGGVDENFQGEIAVDGDDNEIVVVTASIWMPPLISFPSADPMTYTVPLGVVQVGYTFEIASQRGASYLNVILLISLGIMLLGTLATSRIAANVLKPISALSAGLQRISDGHLEHRIDIDYQDEIGAMALRFNSMAERLDASQAQIRQHAKLLEENVIERTHKLQEAYDELQTLDHAKDGFLSSISHEMRTPLTSILASVEILEQFADNDPSARHEFLQIIDREAKRMLSLIVDVLDLAKFEAQTMQLDLVKFDLCRLTSEVVESMRPMASETGVKVTLKHPPLSVFHPCDPQRIRRVIRSLIHNAIKFSPEGQTTEVELSRSAEWVTISVRDHGPGILEEEQDKIFGLFSRTDSGTERATHGVGMGLPISKKIAQLHAGDLRYEDPGDGGARFVLTLPVGAEANSPSRQLSGA